ncbi:MAG TPA: hypothetical protein PKK88_05065 [Bacteroidales bacterium]|nr:hypothetical protein [Bacteroidales bacterium]
MKKLLLSALLLFFFLASWAQPQEGIEKSVQTGYSVGFGQIRSSSYNVAFTYGYRLNPLAYIGAGTGVGITDGNYDKYIIPIYAIFKVNFTKTRISPFFQFNVGYTFGLNSKISEGYNVLYSPSFGADYNITPVKSVYFQLGVDYQGHHLFDSIDYSGFLNKYMTAVNFRVGYKF